jgi:hypothetical protein
MRSGWRLTDATPTMPLRLRFSRRPAACRPTNTIMNGENQAGDANPGEKSPAFQFYPKDIPSPRAFLFRRYFRRSQGIAQAL